MYEATRLLFYTCTSPLHMGAGVAIGAIDNPIQREVHSGLPLIAGSGLKGAVRHHLDRAWAGHADIERMFGPERNGSTNAGAIAFSDALLVCFPVRSTARTFVYATCAYALGRLKRFAATAGVPTDWSVPEPADGKAAMAELGAATNGKLALEAFEYAAALDDSVRKVARWLAEKVFPSGEVHQFFRQKLGADLAVLPDADFNHFVRHATVVEPHVRINDDTGTADDTGLFYTENLPPESILVGLGLSSLERTRNKASEERMPAEAILRKLLDGDQGRPGIGSRVVQMGGDASTGRGLVLVQPAR